MILMFIPLVCKSNIFSVEYKFSHSFVFLTVQFVPMREFMGRAGANPATIQAILAKEVLEEIPDQFLSYMKSRNIKPKPPLQRQLTISSVTSLPVSEQWLMDNLWHHFLYLKMTFVQTISFGIDCWRFSELCHWP